MLDNPVKHARKLTDFSLVREVIEFCTGKEKSKYKEDTAFFNEHSLIRLQLYMFKLTIPTCVSVHFVRHSQTGQFHMVTSNRPDLGGDGNAGRTTPVNHVMVLNAKHLIDMSRYRFCSKASQETRYVWSWIHAAVQDIEPELAKRMEPNCFYRGGICPESNSCGMYKNYGK